MTLDPVHARGVKLMLARRCGELQKASALAERGAECQVHRVTPLLTQTVRPVFQLATSCDELKKHNVQRRSCLPPTRQRPAVSHRSWESVPAGQELHDLKYLWRDGLCVW